MNYTHESLELYIVPMRSDNYSYVVHDRANNQTVVIDPSESRPLVKFLKDKNFGLDMIIDTHHHDDHTQGNMELQTLFGSKIICSAYDQAKDRIPGDVSVTLQEGDRLAFSNYFFQILTTPGHTLGHLCLLLEGANWLFTGDTLFALGCGRLFEGTPAVMWESLKKLRSLPDEALVFCGHEYTLANARFVQHIASNLPGLSDYIHSLGERKKREGGTIPTRLSEEKAFNPFLLADHPLFKNLGNDPVQVFANIRKQKDNFS